MIIMNSDTCCYTLLLIKFLRNRGVLFLFIMLLIGRAARKRCEPSEFSFTRSS
ncbi:hypothetical protein GLYMA_02G055600v4 [Glycine max]|uniref:Uncharacterized protein n=1 Tax=Glycine max TaxID=3847 RepID=K7K6L8_SOYBN|nr:hypothetical protein JHK85_003434 [Glycine max]KAH1058883.1 hypothetical protein GYH30_003109 [Glycine max]KHN00533.1 hypothetical protein glysoja_000201 [Glycine soja]KRH69901.1 hypothetical protein GLYMA_02G055600v4 [Glycine max]